MTQALMEKRGTEAVITLNRPKKMNTINPDLVRALGEKVSEAEEDADLRTVVVRGEGNGFCAGGDIHFLAEASPGEAEEFSRDMVRIIEEMQTSRLPYIAAVHGFAVGGGMELAMACDIVVAEKGSKFGQPETHIGLIPGFGGHQRLLETMGPRLAKELLFTADSISAERAQSIGAVNRVCDEGDALETALEIAESISANSPSAIAASKRVLYNTISSAYSIERAEFIQLFVSDEHKEGTQAFLDKRDPQW